MNETIGEKGGHNDRIRTFKIKENKKKKKIEEDIELKELEHEVKKRQRFVLIKTIPIIIAGNTLKTIFDIANTKTNITKKNYNIKNLEENIDIDNNKDKKLEDNEEEIIVLEDGRKIKVRNNIVIKENNKDYNKEDKEEKKEEAKEEIKHKIDTEKIETIQEIEHYLSDLKEEEFDELSIESKKRLERLKSRKIIDEYEKDLKDVRYDLRNLIFDYNNLVKEEEKIVFREEAEEILDKLSIIIDKLNELKDKIKIDNLEDYDDNYIYTLIEDYLKEFKDGNSIPNFKDSSLYILLSDKIDEFEEKSDELNKEVIERKEVLSKKEKKYDKLKDMYYYFREINNELLQFQNEQDFLLEELREKIKNAKTVSEKVELEVQTMNRQSRRLMNLLALSMFIPGKKSSKILASSMAAYLLLVDKIMHPKKITKKYRVIDVKDYSEDIEKGISSIDEGVDLLSKTDNQIDKVISEINEKYSDYLDILPECRELLSNLKKMKSEISEKEYELGKIKEEEEKLLVENNNKVLTRGKYLM